MQAPLSDLIVTALLAGTTVGVALAAVAALPWSAGEVEATEAALGRGARWVQGRLLLLLAGRSALTAAEGVAVASAVPSVSRARAA